LTYAVLSQRYEGQKGIISTLAFNPDYSGLFAAGSFAKNVGLYAENSNTCLGLYNQIGFGVTHTKWSPCGNYLWVGGRKSNSIICLDIRMTRKEIAR
jgi:WD40 repeat protein